MTLFTDTFTAAVERALGGVAQRQRVTAHNVANAATPGFRAARVEFESALAAAIERGAPASARTSLTAATTPAGPDGNSVSLEAETAVLVKAGLQYDTLVAALTYRFGLLRTAIGR